MNHIKTQLPLLPLQPANPDPVWLRLDVLVLLVPALIKLILHLITAKGYGLNGDELYYLACSDHLAWGYVDQPPLSIALLHVQRALCGDSMLAIRLLPALAGFGTVLLTGLLARRMGARIFGRLLSQICVLVAPVYLAENHYFSMNAFDLLFWLLALYLMACIIDGGKPALWILFGLVMGLGFLNKVGMLFLGFGLVVGLMLTGQRRLLFIPPAWLAALVTALLMLPNIIWQIANSWPTLEWMHNAQSRKMVALSLRGFLKEQVFLMQPLTLFVWGAGFVVLLARPAMARYRPLAWCYLALLALFLVQGGKPYYLAPIYPVLFAAGATAIERWLVRRWIRIIVVTLLVVGGILTAPLGMPILPVQGFINYQAAIGLRPASGERHAEGKLPSFFANMFGWQRLTDVVGAVYHSLPAADQKICGIYCQNYMQAGAIDFYGRRFGLPPAISGHNNYWLWGSRGISGELLIVLGSDAATMREHFAEVSEWARFRDEYIHPIHNDLPVFVVRKPKKPLAFLWPRIKNYI